MLWHAVLRLSGHYVPLARVISSAKRPPPGAQIGRSGLDILPMLTDLRERDADEREREADEREERQLERAARLGQHAEELRVRERGSASKPSRPLNRPRPH